MPSSGDLRQPPRPLGWMGTLPLALAAVSAVGAAVGAPVELLWAALALVSAAAAVVSIQSRHARFELLSAPVVLLVAIAQTTGAPAWVGGAVLATGLGCCAVGVLLVNAGKVGIAAIAGELVGLGVFVFGAAFVVELLPLSSVGAGSSLSWGDALFALALGGWLAYWTPESHRAMRPGAEMFVPVPPELAWRFLVSGYAEWEQVEPDVLEVGLVRRDQAGDIWKHRVAIRSGRDTSTGSARELTAYHRLTVDFGRRMLTVVMLGTPHYCQDRYMVRSAPGGCVVGGFGLLTAPFWNAALGLMLAAPASVRRFSEKRRQQMGARRSRLETVQRQLTRSQMTPDALG